MSEKMIEMKRQRMGMSPHPSAAFYQVQGPHGYGSNSVHSNTNIQLNGSSAILNHHHTSQHQHHSIVSKNSQDSSIGIATCKDKKLEHFLNLLSSSNFSSSLSRCDRSQCITSCHGKTVNNQNLSQPSVPTVPIALTRRILHKQGCAYLDPNISTLISHASDKFLATVLSQALTCRKFRLQGDELRRRKITQDKLDKKRRRDILLSYETQKRKKMSMKEKKYEETIEKAKKLFNRDVIGGSTSIMKNKGGSSKKKNAASSTVISHNKTTNPLRSTEIAMDCNKKKTFDGNDVDPHKSNDDKLALNSDCDDDSEENYYTESSDSDDSNASNIDYDCNSSENAKHYNSLNLRDLEKPLQTWGLSFTGKVDILGDICHNSRNRHGNFQDNPTKCYEKSRKVRGHNGHSSSQFEQAACLTTIHKKSDHFISKRNGSIS